MTLTTVSVLTPSGRGAIATLVVAGPAAISAVVTRFRAARPLPPSGLRPQQIYFGTWQSASDSLSPGEELIVCRTAEDRVEVHCHGGHAAVRAIVASLLACGCHETDWVESMRARATCLLSLRPLSRWQQDAAQDLARATTERAATILLDQYQGALDHEIDQAMQAAARGAADERDAILDRLLGTADVGQHLVEPWRVVLAGPPNVGKSSLINALVGYERSVTFDQPGTTRDVINVNTAFDGWPIQLSDTAGLRETNDRIERQGVLRARDRLLASDLALLIFAADQLDETVVRATLDEIALPGSGRDRVRAMVVITKSDLWAQPDAAAWLPADAIQVSAQTRAGISDLIDAVCQRLVPIVPQPGGGVLFRKDQVREVELLRHSFGSG